MNNILAHTTAGNGFPVVLLPGFCETKDLWAHFVPQLAQSYTVICADLPGLGQNPPLQSDITIEQMAEAVNQLANHLGLNKFVLIGHSLGGYVTLAYAELYPNRLAGLGLFNSHPFADSPEKQQARTEVANIFLTDGVTPDWVEGFLGNLFPAHRTHNLANQINFARQMVSKTPGSSAAYLALAMRNRPNRTHVLQNAPCPVMFVAGKIDAAAPFDALANTFFMPPHSSVLALDNTAHMAMFEHENKTLAFVKAFVEGVAC